MFGRTRALLPALRWLGHEADHPHSTAKYAWSIRPHSPIVICHNGMIINHIYNLTLLLYLPLRYLHFVTNISHNFWPVLCHNCCMPVASRKRQKDIIKCMKRTLMRTHLWSTESHMIYKQDGIVWAFTWTISRQTILTLTHFAFCAQDGHTATVQRWHFTYLVNECAY